MNKDTASHPVHHCQYLLHKANLLISLTSQVVFAQGTLSGRTSHLKDMKRFSPPTSSDFTNKNLTTKQNEAVTEKNND
uniref:Uncharacterized protein n=1 Tax=Rhodnius prolixus TaxID=13249 RepID=T1HGN4_RHOPR